MDAQTFLNQFGHIAEARGGIAKLRELVLQLAVQGKFTEQKLNDKSAARLRSEMKEGRDALKKTLSGATLIDVDRGIEPFEIPQNWVNTCLADLGVFLGGGTPSKQNSGYWNGTIPWVSPKDMKQLRIDDAVDHISEQAVSDSSAKLIPPPSLLMVVRGMILAHSFPVAITSRELAINQDMKALHLVVPETADYLLTACRGLKYEMLHRVERSSHGTCRLSTDSVATFPIPLPPLEEQKRIVAKVDELMGMLDELEQRQVEREQVRRGACRATLHHLTTPNDNAPPNKTTPAPWPRLEQHFPTLIQTPADVKDLRQTILQLAVMGKLVEQDPNDEPAEKLLEHISTERQRTGYGANNHQFRTFNELAAAVSVPEGWSLVPLAKTALTIVDCPHSTPKWTDSGLLCVRTNQFRPGTLDLTGSRYVSQATYAERVQRLVPQVDDILYSREGGILGVACRVPSDTMLCLGQRMMLIRPPSAILATYLELVLNSPLITRIAHQRTTGAAAPRVNVSTVNAYPIPVPPKAEQARIVARVNELLALCDTLEQQLTNHQTTATQLTESLIASVLNG